jgi:hypothetical protein
MCVSKQHPPVGESSNSGCSQYSLSASKYTNAQAQLQCLTNSRTQNINTNADQENSIQYGENQ